MPVPYVQSPSRCITACKGGLTAAVETVKGLLALAFLAALKEQFNSKQAIERRCGYLAWHKMQ